MTLVSVQENAQNTKRGKDITLQCDECYILYSCPTNYRTRALKSTLHFCSKQCSNQSFAQGQLKLKINQKMTDKYGQLYIATEKFKQQQKDQCLALYGVDNRLQASEILEKIKQTNLQKYGRSTFVGSAQHQASLDHQDIAFKAWQTKIKNGTCSRSSVEERVAEILTPFFTFQRQVPIIKQWVDFYILDLKLYLQIDGVYWHGLNRPVTIIAQQITDQDKKIYKQILRDQQLNQYMKDHQLKLLRLTDQQVKSLSDEEIITLIRSY